MQKTTIPTFLFNILYTESTISFQNTWKKWTILKLFDKQYFWWKNIPYIVYEKFKKYGYNNLTLYIRNFFPFQIWILVIFQPQ